MTREYWEGLGREVEYDEREIEEWLATHPQLTNYLSENLSIILRRVTDPVEGQLYHAAFWYRGCEAGNLWSVSLSDLLREVRERIAAGPTDEIFDE